MGWGGLNQWNSSDLYYAFCWTPYTVLRVRSFLSVVLTVRRSGLSAGRPVEEA